MRRVRLSIDCKLESKSSSIASRIAFQDEVEKQLKRQHRQRAFTVPVIVELRFNPHLVNPPSIQALAKHYLDLLQAPVAGSSIKRKRLLLKDDRLVHVLICTYDLSDAIDTGMSIEIATLNDFMSDLDLYRRITTRDFDDADDFHSDWPEVERDEDRFSDAISEYRRDLEGEKQYVARGQADLWKTLHFWTVRHLQEQSLRGRELNPGQLGQLYGTRARKYLGADLNKALESMQLIVHKMLMQAMAFMDFGPPAVKEGESELFRKKVRSDLAKVRKRHPFLFPLLTTLGVTIAYIPPEKGLGIDLDNLARKIIPLIHEELKPPPTFLHILKSQKAVGTMRCI